MVKLEDILPENVIVKYGYLEMHSLSFMLYKRGTKLFPMALNQQRNIIMLSVAEISQRVFAKCRDKSLRYTRR